MGELRPKQIVVGQRVADAKKIASRNLRRNMTSAETFLWSRLRGRQVEGAKFRRQQVIEGFIADFYCHEAALVIEIDGPTHETQYDAERDAVFKGHRITTLRFTNTEIFHELDKVLSHICKALNSSIEGTEPKLLSLSRRGR